jgi:hypothetical protein
VSVTNLEHTPANEPNSRPTVLRPVGSSAGTASSGT